MVNKISIILLVIALCASISFAKKYSDPSGPGAGQGTSTIGTTLCDYSTLYDAAWDFDTTPNTGSWTMLVQTDLTEPVADFFGNTVLSGSTITLKPGTGVNPTITFTNPSDNAGWTGDFIIGANFSNNGSNYANIYTKTDNFVIDGSNNGTNSQNLTLAAATTQTFANRIITEGGACNNVVIKNCKLENKPISPAGKG